MWRGNGQSIKNLESYNTKLIDLKTKLDFKNYQKILLLKAGLPIL